MRCPIDQSSCPNGSKCKEGCIYKPAPTALAAPNAQPTRGRCEGIDHEWTADWHSGDTCYCGARYAFTDGAKLWTSEAR